MTKHRRDAWLFPAGATKTILLLLPAILLAGGMTAACSHSSGTAVPEASQYPVAAPVEQVWQACLAVLPRETFTIISADEEARRIVASRPGWGIRDYLVIYLYRDEGDRTRLYPRITTSPPPVDWLRRERMLRDIVNRVRKALEESAGGADESGGRPRMRTAPFPDA